jgi:hypothetical protein
MLAIAVAIVSTVVGTFNAWPKRRFSIAFTHPATTITIKVGDVLDESGHLVIGFSDRGGLTD